MKFKGLDAFQKKLNKINREVERQIDGTHSVPIGELMSPSFIRKYTGGKFNHIDEISKLCPAEANTAEEAEAMFKSAEWNALIKEHTIFSSWDNMVKKAGEEHIAKKMNNIIKKA